MTSSPTRIITNVQEILRRYGQQEGALIPVLQRVQRRFGYLPAEALHEISRFLEIPYSEVCGVVGFYSYFTTVPRGEYTIRVCLGTACYVRGGKEVLDAIRREIGIDLGETTADRRFSLEIGRCFGACGLAPVVMINDVVHQRVSPACIAKILQPYREEPLTPTAPDEEVIR